MNLSGFDDCMQAASEIQSASEGRVPGHLGVRVNSGIDSNDHIAQFNAGLNAIETMNTHHIPLSESGEYNFNVKLLRDNLPQIENWLKTKLLGENAYKALDKKQSDIELKDKTSFLKDMNVLFTGNDNKSEITKSISAYITSHDLKSVRKLIAKLSNVREESTEVE